MIPFFRLLTLSSLILVSPLFSEEEEGEIAFEENTFSEECDDENRPCKRLRYQDRFNPEEEKLYEERNETSWPSKRGDPMIEQLLR